MTSWAATGNHVSPKERKSARAEGGHDLRLEKVDVGRGPPASPGSLAVRGCLCRGALVQEGGTGPVLLDRDGFRSRVLTHKNPSNLSAARPRKIH